MSELAKKLIAENIAKRERGEDATVLDLGNCGLTEVPEEVGELVWLEELILSNEWMDYDSTTEIWRNEKSSNAIGIPNTLKDLSENLKNLQNLRIVVLSGLGISSLENLTSLTNLRKLICANTKIQSLEPIKNLKSLEYLFVYSNEISDLSPIAGLLNLKIIDLDSTSISSVLPIDKLYNLTQISFSTTRVNSLLPLLRLKKINKLYCDSTLVEDLSPIKHLFERGLECKISNWGHEKGVYIDNSPIVTPPLEIVAQGNAAILNWFSERSKAQFQNTEIKLILIGNSTAGKTSLSRYLRERVYEHGQPSTHGIQNERWTPEGRELEVNIWDFGGQEYYHATHRLFLSRNSVYALVWDAQTDAGGYCDTDIHYEHDPVPHQVRLEHFPHTWWLQNIRHYTQGSNQPAPVLLVQNKCARDGVRRVSSDLEQPPYALLPEWLDNPIDLAAFAEDAPETERRKWTRRFEDFEERLLDKLETQLAHYEFATYHRDIRDEVRRRAAAGVNDMTYADFEAMCRSFDEEAKMDLVCIYLHDITGDILYYPEHPLLRERVFLRPDWVCNRIYAILSREVLTRQGLFGLDWVQQALQCDELEALDFIELMRELELIFDDKDEEGLTTGNYVAPQYLPDTCMAYDELKGARKYANLTHAFTLWFPHFLPKSHIARFVAHWGSQAQQRLYWKNGLLFITAGCTALVERVEGNRIRVDIQAGQTTREEAMRQVFQSFLKLEDGEAAFAVSMNGEDFVDWSAVREAEWTRAREIACRQAAQDSKKYVTLSPFQVLLQPAKMTAKKIFISYSKADRAYLDTARRFLRPMERQGTIALWDDTQLLPGQDWDAAIRRELAAADMILFLVSADLLATDYIWDIEMQEAMARAARGEVAVVPVIIRPCGWEDAPFARYTALPTKGKAIASWDSPDEAWAEVTGRIRHFVNGGKGSAVPPSSASAAPAAPSGTQITNSKNVISGSTISAGGNVHIGDVYHHGAEAPKTGKTTDISMTPTEKQGIERAIELKIKVINRLREKLATEDDPTRSVRYEEQLQAAEGELAELKGKLS